MNKLKKHGRYAVLAAALCLLLTACGDKVEPPEAYVIGENSTVPLDSFLDEEEGGKLTAIEAPETEEDEDGKDEKDKKDDDSKDDKKKDKDDEGDAKQLSEKTDSEEDGSGEEGAADAAEVYTYTYEEVPAAALDRYAAALVADEEGFRVIDEERAPQTDLPDFSTEEGSTAFARKAVEEDTLFQIAIDWNTENCIVKVSCEPGGFYGEDGEGDSSEDEEEESLTLVQTIDFINSLSPSDLGLEGSSMSEYNVLPTSGNPLVDGELCRHINIYQTDPQAGTNVVKGTFLVGMNKVYRLHMEDNTVELVYQR